jgi:hypothetical protein
MSTGFTQAGLTPQTAIVNADGTPTVFFFRWLMASRAAMLSSSDLQILESFDAGALDGAADAGARIDEALALASPQDAAQASRDGVGDGYGLGVLALAPPAPDNEDDRYALAAYAAAPPVSTPIAIPASAPVLASDGSALVIPATLPHNDVWVGDASGVPVPTALSAIAAPSLAAQIAYGTADLTLTTAYAPITGAAITIAAAGTYLITAVFDFSCMGAGDAGAALLGALSVASAIESQVAVFSVPAAGARIMVSQQWILALSAGTVLQLMAEKTGGTGASVCYAGSTTTVISAIRVA